MVNMHRNPHSTLINVLLFKVLFVGAHQVAVCQTASQCTHNDSFFRHGGSNDAGEKLIQIASDSLVTEILIHPQVNTFKQCLRNLMASFTRHRHIVHAGYTLSGTGSWILQVSRIGMSLVFAVQCSSPFEWQALTGCSPFLCVPLVVPADRTDYSIPATSWRSSKTQKCNGCCEPTKPVPLRWICIVCRKAIGHSSI